ncbi:ribosome associated inhibitor A [Staphylococcus phage LJLAME001]
MKKRQKMFHSNLVCSKCGNTFTVPRKRAQRREEGHIKHLYCIKCKCTTAHIEDNRTESEKYWDRVQEELSR